MAMRVVTFGEIMMRLATPEYSRFSQASRLELSYGGAEANVAVALAAHGVPASFVTRLPRNPFGDEALRRLHGLGVDTSHVARGGEDERIGLYFLETGAGPRPSVVIYDRAASAFARAAAGNFDWPAIFAGASWFHFSGITPALGPGLAQLTAQACRIAKSAGLTVSCDLNYRRKLWSPEQAKACLNPLMQWVDVAIGFGADEAAMLFDIELEDAQNLSRTDYEHVARALSERFGFKSVALALRESRSADANGWSGLLLHHGLIHRSRSYDIRVVDRVGTGDAFAGGLIRGLLLDAAPQETLDFAVAASCLKHSVRGDFNIVSTAEVEALMQGDASGRVQR